MIIDTEQLSRQVGIYAVVVNWCEEALRQGIQLLSLIEEHNYLGIDNEYGRAVMRSHIHEDYFAYALSQILDFGRGLTNPPEELTEFIAQCDANGHVKDIRGMRTHGADYLCPNRKPHFPERYTVDLGTGTIDASSSISSHETGWMIGGRLPLQKTMKDISLMLPEIRRFHDACMRQTSGA